MSKNVCPICVSAMHKISGSYSICKSCRYMMSEEQPGAGAEVISLEAVREKNFRFICKKIRKIIPYGKTILDVGSSTGHFLRVANSESLSSTGLEPDVGLAEMTRLQGLNIINEFFPNAEDLFNHTYDIIIFNDSFEHIPNLQEIVLGIKRLLKSNGIVIVNLPTSDGIIFKISYIFNKMGIKAPFDRLWQKGFASPHLHFFNLRNLKQFSANNGFAMQYSSPLYYYTVKGLWHRISCKESFFISIFTWFFMVLLYPVFTLYSDCFMACFSLSDKNGGNT